MLQTFTYPKYPFQTPPELTGQRVGTYPVVVVGAGPVGLVAAIELAQSGTPVLLLDEDNTVSIGSRGVCYAKRTLEVLDRIGVGDTCVEKGVTWNIGRTFFDQDQVYQFNLQPAAGHKRPGMINLQQYYLEDILVQRAQQEDSLEIRFHHKVVAVSPQADGVQLEIDTPEGRYSIDADWLIVADGARSPIRQQLGLDMQGQVFRDRFLIADVVMKADYPAERWFWFNPPFHPGQSVLLHKQADNVWRIDFQLGWDADPEEEKKPERVIARIQAMFGDDRGFELEWVSVYTFQCRSMESLRHNRLLFVGDAAHQVSPFGARGANSGIQDVDNLCWKLKLVLQGKAPEILLDSYNEERTFAAQENILHSTRSTDFITPKSQVSTTFRNAVLTLAGDYDFARMLVNSGRLSVPTYITDSPLNTVDSEIFAGDMVPGAAMDDAPVEQANGHGALSTWLLDYVGNNRFTVLLYLASDQSERTAQYLKELQGIANSELGIQPIIIVAPGNRLTGCDYPLLLDSKGLFQSRYDAQDGTVYIIRPDQHVCARWRSLQPERVTKALQKATGRAARNEYNTGDVQQQPKQQPEAGDTSLRLTPNFYDVHTRYFQKFSPGDDFYNTLIESHRDLSDEHSANVNSRLILLLANHIGDIGVLKQAIAVAHSQPTNSQLTANQPTGTKPKQDNQTLEDPS